VARRRAHVCTGASPAGTTRPAACAASRDAAGVSVTENRLPASTVVKTATVRMESTVYVSGIWLAICKHALKYI